MKRDTRKQIEKALVNYGDGSGRYLQIVDRLAMWYDGKTLSRKVANMMNIYLALNGFKNMEEASREAKFKARFFTASDDGARIDKELTEDDGKAKDLANKIIARVGNSDVEVYTDKNHKHLGIEIFCRDFTSREMASKAIQDTMDSYRTTSSKSNNNGRILRIVVENI